MKPLAKAKSKFIKFITLDIETRTIDNKLTPFCICFYDGLKKKSFYITSFKNSEAMISSALNSILTNKDYTNYVVFAHNLSKFDGVFITIFLLSIKLNYKVNIIKRDSDIINITLTSDSSGFNITFRDSLLLLPSSLRKLAKSFGVNEKSIFPYTFVNDPTLDLNYTGNVPDFKYFTKITLDQYNNYCTNFKVWSLKNETIKYCLQDCVVLYQVLRKFSSTIFKDLKVNLKYAPTTSSLALRSFRTSFLEASGIKFIPIIHGRRSRDI